MSESNHGARESLRLPQRLAVLGMSVLAALGAHTAERYDIRPIDQGVSPALSEPGNMTLSRMWWAEQIAARIRGPEPRMAALYVVQGADRARACENPASNDPQLDKTCRVVDLLQGSGFTLAQSAGVVANLYAESGLVANIEQVGGDGYGIAMWTNQRRQSLEDFAQVNGRDVADLGTQVDFMLDELNSTEMSANIDLRQQNTPARAAQSFQNNFERIPNNW